MKRLTVVRRIILTGTLLTISGCAAHANFAVDHDAAGFWRGLWHGLIIPITFLISLVNSNVNIYEVVNNGGFYNFGFVLGVLLLGMLLFD
jgi:hypothetical protein